jgi:hypothetical protein
MYVRIGLDVKNQWALNVSYFDKRPQWHVLEEINHHFEKFEKF